jgi:hypothetical protein
LTENRVLGLASAHAELAAAAASTSATAWPFWPATPNATGLGPLPPLGSFMPVVLSQEAAHAIGGPARLPRPGDWVRLRGVQSLCVAGTMQAYYSASSVWSRAQAASDLLQSALERLRRGHVNLHAGRPMQWGARVSHACPTSVSAASQQHPPSSLRQLMATRALPSYHRVCARVTGVDPQRPHAFTLPRGALNAAAAAAAAARGDPPPPPLVGPADCGALDDAGEAAYALSLELTDGTGRLIASLLDGDGARFFGAIRAVPMSPGCAAADELQSAMDGLVCRGGAPPPGMDEPPGQPAERHATWAQFVVVAYLDAQYKELPPGADGLDVNPMDRAALFRRFRIVDTVLRPRRHAEF